MAIALVAHTLAQSATQNTVVSGAINTTGANLLVLVLSWYVGGGGGQPVISDSKGNTWTALTSRANNSGADLGQRVFYAVNPTVGSGHTFTAASSNGYESIAIAAFSGADTTTPFDLEAGASGSTSTAASGSITPSAANEVVIAGLSNQDALGGLATIGGGFTISDVADRISTGVGVGLAYLIQTSAAAANPTWTLASGMPWIASIGSFKAGASSGSTGTLATTNANDTSAASGTTTVRGTLARTNANDTSAASGKTTVLGTLAKTNANDTSAASGSVGGAITGTLATTNQNDTGAASGTTTVVGTVARTNANDAGAATGWAGTITGTAATTNANDTVNASGTVQGGAPTPAGKSRKPILVEINGRIQEFESQANLDAYLTALVPAEDKQIIAKARRIAKAVVRSGNAFVPPVFEPVRMVEGPPALAALVNMRAALTQAKLNEAVNEQIARERDRDDEENAVAVMLLL